MEVKHVSKIMKEKGISSVRLAKAIDVATPTVSIYKRGLSEPKYNRGVKICKVLNVSPHKIRFGKI